MNLLLITQGALVIIGAILATIFVDFSSASAILAGGGTMLLNLVALVYSWPRLLAKKSVALSIGVIVFKFAILGWIIYQVVGKQVFHLGWFALGMGLVVPTVIFTALKMGPKSPEKAEN